jgi:hypothetical protein
MMYLLIGYIFVNDLFLRATDRENGIVILLGELLITVPFCLYPSAATAFYLFHKIG